MVYNPYIDTDFRFRFTRDDIHWSLDARYNVQSIRNIDLLRFVVKDDLNILGTSKILYVLMTFYFMLGVVALIFYDAEHWNTNSSIKTIGESFWYIIQMASGATFGPSPVTFEGKIVGAIR